ncbi:MAG: hypothetical protein MZV64_73455 [Ignavibacteriales bacterium]|nr:hypothetical protein [Ignavibacteriales bacterium]
MARAIAPGGHVVLIENAPGSGDARRGDGCREACAPRTGVPAGAPMVLYTGTFEAYQGLDLLFAAMARVLAQAAGRPPRAGGRAPRPGRAGAAARRTRKASARRPSSRASARPRRFRRSSRRPTCWCRRGAAGKNTPLKIYQYLRAAAGRLWRPNLLTHTQVLDATVAALTDPTPDAFGAGILRVLNDRERARRRSARRRRTRQHALHVRGVRASGPREALPADDRRETRRRRRRREATDHYSYRVYADPGDGRPLRRDAVQRPDRHAARRGAGPGDRVVSRRRSRGGPCSTSAPERGAPPSGWRGAAPASRASTRRPRCCASRGARAAEAGLDGRLRGGRRAPAGARRPGVSTAPSASGCSCTRPTGGGASSELCRVARRSRGVRLSGGVQRGGAPGRSAGAWRAAAGRPVEAYRVLTARRRHGAQLEAAGFRIAQAHRQFVLPIALHKALGSRAFTVAVEKALARGRPPARCWVRRSPSWRCDARPSHRRDRVHRRPPGAPPARRGATPCARSCGARTSGRAALAADGRRALRRAT